MIARDSRGTTPAESDDVRTSIETLFRAHWDELCLVAAHLVGSSDAEDIVMEVVTAVLRRAPGDPSIISASYLFGSVRQEARKFGRRRAHRRQRLAAWTDLQETDGWASRDPERVLAMKERTKVLYEAVAALPEGQREAFEARYVRLLSLREAAERLGKTESNVERQTSRACRRLRAVLQSRGFESIDDVDGRDHETPPA